MSHRSFLCKCIIMGLAALLVPVSTARGQQAPEPTVTLTYSACRVTLEINDPFQGVIVVYTDASEHHGAYLYAGADAGLYSTRSVTIEDVYVDLPFPDRDHVAISGVEHVRIHDFMIAGNRTAFVLDSSYGAPDMNNRLCVVDGVVTRTDGLIVNGDVEFFVPRPLSQYAGFQSAYKIKIWTNTLSDEQIDSMWP